VVIAFPYFSFLWHLTYNQKVLIYTKHIKKINAELYSLALRSKIADKQS